MIRSAVANDPALSTVSPSIVFVEPGSVRSCFGCFCRESGQNLSPDPPAIIAAYRCFNVFSPLWNKRRICLVKWAVLPTIQHRIAVVPEKNWNSPLFHPTGEKILKTGAVRRVAFIGNHTPRQCGLATFTADIAHAVAGTGVDTQVVAINDRVEGYEYPENVTFQVDETNLQSYRYAGNYLNSQQPDVICVQHEYGIYGGNAGAHLLTLLREVNAPIVTTLHTILRDPSPAQCEVLTELVLNCPKASS